MIRLLLLLLFIAALGSAAAWFAEHPGQVTMYWFDRRIDTSFAFLALAMLLATLLVAYAYIMARRIVQAPAHLRQARQLRQYRKGLGEITRSVAALAGADIRHAERHTRKAEKFLGQTPLILLLSAQIARSKGDDDKTRALLERMLAHNETEYLAARSLSEAADKHQLLPAALAMAERALAVNPKEAAAARSVIGLQLRLGHWQEALAAAGKPARKSGLTRAERRRLRGLAHLMQGRQLLRQHQPIAALPEAQSAAKLLPGFVPAALLLARTYEATGRKDKAIAAVFKAWKQAPHPELASQLRGLMAGEPKQKQLKLAHRLVALSASPESALEFAETAIVQREWDKARKALKAALAREESARACRLMAELEQGEHADYEAKGKWLARSAGASPDPGWVCDACGQATREWEAHCPACSAFDTLEWKRRELQFVADASLK